MSIGFGVRGVGVQIGAPNAFRFLNPALLLQDECLLALTCRRRRRLAPTMNSYDCKSETSNDHLAAQSFHNHSPQAFSPATNIARNRSDYLGGRRKKEGAAEIVCRAGRWRHIVRK